jgi:PAS domain-containing protein
VLVDHTITWVQAKAELESNEQGIFTGGFGTVQDITEQRKSFQDLK